MAAHTWLTRGAFGVGLVLAVAALALADSAPSRPATGSTPSAPAVSAPSTKSPAADEPVHAAPPPFTEGIFPCTQCHDGGGDPTRRELAFHEDVKLRHAPNHWCVDCHDLANRDVLHLAGGEPVPFTESYRLCAQCHFDKHRDWRLGIHGKRVGQWNGAKTALLCVHCHNPHAPRFGTLKPAPRPARPEEMRR